MEPRNILIYLALKANGDYNVIHKLMRERFDFEDEEAERAVKSLKCKTLTYMDPEYPECFKFLACPPLVLFYYGDISLLNDRQKIMGVVGSRECSNYSRTLTYKIVKDLARDHIIISGLALGIDATAHQAAIDAGGKTIAVMGSGIEFCYLKDNRELYEEIKKNHLVISEYPGREPALPYHFPFRNRIIAHLSRILFVPEAKDKSGTMTTVGFAMNTCDLVACLPQRVEEEGITNSLIRNGASLIENAEQLRTDIESLNKYGMREKKKFSPY